MAVTTDTCSCCRKDPPFCRCHRVRCELCHLCIIHCFHETPRLPDPAEKPPVPKNADRAICRGCGAKILWVITPKGKRMPLDENGRPHWGTCSRPEIFRKKKAGAK